MAVKWIAASAISLAIGLIPGVSASAATMNAKIIVQQKSAGPYRLVLRIGPTENMVMKGKGEMMLGGNMATCHAGGTMSMGAKGCNHHLELHVYNAHSNRVVRNATLSITLQDAHKHMTISVPIMTMMSSQKGMRDFHYGNNIYAAPGHYTVKVRVNRVKANFSVHIL